MTRRLRVLLPLMLLAATAAGVGYWLWKADGAGEDGAVTLYGNVDMREAELAFEVPGRLADIAVEEGDRVAEGDLLATLESSRQRQAVAEARARVAAQRQQVLELTRGSRPQEIKRARAQVEAARAERDQADSQLQRLRGLAERRYVSPQRLDDAKAALRAARAHLQAARESLDLAREGPRREQIAAARAQLEAYEAALARSRKDLADTKLYAPAAGIVRERLMEPGEMASPQAPVLALARRDAVWVRAFLPEPQLGRVHPGMAADIRTDTSPDRAFPARVGHISPSAEFTPKTVETTEVRPDLVYRIRINACRPFDTLRLGMPVTVVIHPGKPPADGACP
ncbi:MAG TPA: efflux RND transporter periplasmic adaptor subunit [Gammaproteobacteria bacterium]|nr:efflux RND transporter periplasmic adaptor subunit [Gammaproteobacteria bacterium]